MQDEDKDVFSAEREALSSGRITPLLKVELWAKIQSRRLSEGKEELKVEFKPPEATLTKLTEEEEEKQIVRREKNRLAALKCRRKRKAGKQKMELILEELQDRNRTLKDQLAAMESEKQMILEQLNLPHSCVFQPQEESDKISEADPPDPFQFEDNDDDELSDIYLRSSQEVPSAQEFPQPQPSSSVASVATPYSEVSVDEGDIDSWIGSSFISLDRYIQ